jgi:hypothetical protein
LIIRSLGSLYFFQFFPTTGRDELYQDNDQLYHDGIDIDRASDWSKAQEIAIEHRSMFPPGYDETQIEKDLPPKRKLKRTMKKVEREKRIT